MRSFEEYWNEHGDVYAMEIAENAWDYQQSKIDELQKQLIDQGQRLNVQTQQIASLKWQLKRLGYTDNGGELMKPPIGDAPKFDLLDELQKRVDAAIRLLVEAELYQSEPNIDLAVQALKGGSTPNLNTDENGGCRHFSTTMFVDGKSECFHCDAVVNEEREVIGKQSKGLNPFFTKTFSKEPK